MRKLKVFAVMAAAMALARVYVGAHYPEDVLAGLALGATLSVSGYLIARPVLRQLVVRAATTRLRPLIMAAGEPDARSSM